jgi:hypothetical protein
MIHAIHFTIYKMYFALYGALCGWAKKYIYIYIYILGLYIYILGLLIRPGRQGLFLIKLTDFWLCK